MALSACMLEAACMTDGILWPHSAPRVSTFAYSPPGCAQTWTLTVRNGAKLSIYAYSPPRCAHTWTLAVRNRGQTVHICVQPAQVYAYVDAYRAEWGRTVHICVQLAQVCAKAGRCCCRRVARLAFVWFADDALQGNGGGASHCHDRRRRGGKASHNRNQHSAAARWGTVPLQWGTNGTADAGIATVHPYACTLPSQLVLFGQKNPPAHLWTKRPVSTTSCAVDVRLRGGGKKHWVGEGGAKCG
jgi:hypothetical protein